MFYCAQPARIELTPTVFIRGVSRYTRASSWTGNDGDVDLSNLRIKPVRESIAAHGEE
ncbi:MAG: hypothetical protein LBH36_02230 [Candidatus Nomurabacteria bacterium]|nr:hypothetical protein [Candidatus Nomurabacteria bacterium]